MLKKLETWDQVFEACGGAAEIGRAVGVSTEHAAAMRRRGRIPSRYWMDLVRDAKARGVIPVTYEALACIDAQSARERQSQSEVA